MYHSRDALSQFSGYPETLAVVTLQAFHLGKQDLLTVYLGKLDFLSVTDFSLHL